MHAPGSTTCHGCFAVIHHQLLAHGLAVAAIRSASSAQVGLTNNHSPVIALDPTAEGDILAAERMDLLYNRQYLDPVLLSRSPGDPVELYGPLADDVIQDGDMDIVGAPMDFLGVNYYSPQWVKAPGPDNPLGFELVDAPAEYPRTAFDWPVVPDALTDLLLRLRSDYATRLPPLYVTENGTSWPEPIQ